jgi:hypothetical protein
MERSATQRSEVRFLVFSASLRCDSLNTRLADLATAAIEAEGGIVDRAVARLLLALTDTPHDGPCASPFFIPTCRGPHARDATAKGRFRGAQSAWKNTKISRRLYRAPET